MLNSLQISLCVHSYIFDHFQFANQVVYKRGGDVLSALIR